MNETIFHSFGRPLTFLIALLATSVPTFAAPPAQTSLFPGGMQRGTTIEVTASGTFDKWPVQAWTSNRDMKFVASKEKGTFTVTASADLSPDVYWIRLYDNSGATGLRPFLVSSMREIPETEPNDETRNAPFVELPAVVNGKLAKTGDVDCFSVKLKKGQSLISSIEAHRTLRSPMDCILQLVTPDGTVLAENHDYRGLDPRLVFTAPRTETYVVRLFAFPSNPDSSIRFFGSDLCVYRLTLSTDAFVDFATPFAAEWGHDCQLSLSGWNVPSPTIRLTGYQVASFPKWLHGSIAITRESHRCYDTIAEPIPASLTPPFSLTGEVGSSGSRSTIPLIGTKGQSLHLTLEAGRRGSLLEPVVRILDRDKKQLVKAEPATLHGDCEFTFTPPVDGTYTMEVRDLHRRGSPRHVFLTRVVPLQPTFAPTITTDRLTLTAGTPLDIPVTLNKQNGWTKPLNWFAEGLPKGVSMHPIHPKGVVDPNIATLRFEAENAGEMGRIRIVSETLLTPSTFKIVTSSQSDFGTSTSDFWLTVLSAEKVPSK